MKKKILMISSTWTTAFIHTLLHGMVHRLENSDAELYVFNAYDEALESEYHQMERAIYFLPDVKQFDGILLAVNSVGNQGVVRELSGYYKDQGMKILSLELQLENIPSIGTKNYDAEYALVEHMIEKHGCRVLSYIGGPVEHIEDQERCRAFRDCLTAHQIPIDEKMIRHYSFTETDGLTAYADMKELGTHLPDAVICANDHMALGYCTAAAKDGFYAPADFRITGFDNTDNGQRYSPSITSVNRSWAQLGYDSMAQLLDMIEGTYEEKNYFSGARLSINESCGCCENQRDYQSELREGYQRTLIEEQQSAFERKSRKLLCGSSDIMDFRERLSVCKDLAGFQNIAVCLNPSPFNETLTSKRNYDPEFMCLSAEGIQTLRRKESLIPHGWKEKVFLFSPLHFGTLNFGYCVIPYTESWEPMVDHRNFMESICLGLEGIRQHADLQRAKARLEDLYVRDAMTGMYNRFGYEQIAREYFLMHEGEVYTAYFDMDNLKPINDRYGHGTGDQAICGIAEGIAAVFEEDSVQVRMGGDEFLVIGPYKSGKDLEHKTELLHAYLNRYREEKKIPLSLEVSIGYVANDKKEYTLEQLIHLADQKMYEIKQKRKQSM